MLENFRKTVRGVIDRMFGRNSFTAASIPVSAITDEMAAAIDRWVALYYSRAPWQTINKRLSLGLPASIAREIATLVTLEAKVNVGDPNNSDALNPRAQLIEDALKPVLDQLTIQTEYACAFGGIVFRPYMDGGKICVDFINADNFYPTQYNARGEITGAIFIEKKHTKNETYIRVEQHTMMDGGVYVVTNRAFKGYGKKTDIGTPISLTDVDEWRDIAPEVTLNGIESPLFAYFKIPHGNVIDADSHLGVSVYARADIDGVLEEADNQFRRLAWEYEAGEMAVDASMDAFKQDKDGRPILPAGKERLFRVNWLDSKEAGSGKFSVYAPSLRDGNYSEGLNRILMRVEDLCGLARGTYSDINTVARTATELNTSRQRTYATVSSIQRSLQTALDALAGAINTFASLYALTPEGEYEITYTWDDSIVVDAGTEREKDRGDVADGLMMPWEYRVKWYGETEERAKAVLQEARDSEATPMDRALRNTFEPEMTEE